MNTVRVLDPTKHQEYKVDTRFCAEFGDNRHIIDIVPSEFRSVCAYYPILISKDKNTGEYLFVALLGFSNSENLYLQDDKWDANYIPLNIRRVPFAVDFVQSAEQNHKVPVLCIDEDHPRVNQQTGEALFHNGSASGYLQNMQGLVKRLLEGVQSSKLLASKMNEYGLIEPMNINLTFVDGSEKSLDGLYTINESKLANLTDTEVIDLYKHNLIEPLYAMLASLSQLGNLVNRKNALVQE